MSGNRWTHTDVPKSSRLHPSDRIPEKMNARSPVQGAGIHRSKGATLASGRSHADHFDASVASCGVDIAGSSTLLIC